MTPTEQKAFDAMREALDELADLVEASLKGEYTPDSFTTQPARTAITAANAVSHPKPETTPPQEGGAITAESAANAVSHPQATEPAWRPIETAPKDTQILVAAEFYGAGDWRIKSGYLDDSGWHIWGASWTPAHWQPLPAAPEAA